MMISTRGRYALRVLIDLAEHYSGKYIPMKEVAARQDISLNYIERIIPVLTKANLVRGIHGKGGGYQLTKAPSQYKVGDILRLTEGDLAPVACLGCDAKKCDRADVCRTLPMWERFHKMTGEYFDSITLEDLMKAPSPESGT
jgi:Rrf2 family protein